jgi:hypothetical protein
MLRRSDLGLEGEIPFSYTNTTGETVYVVNCNEFVPPMLEKQEGDMWVPAWGAAVPDCLDPPIVIQPGETYGDTLSIFSAHADRNMVPIFEVEDVEGIYRLVWPDVVYNYDMNRPGFGDPLPVQARISNRFVLRVE